MRNITQARRNLFKRGQNNGIKILSLGVGLAVGLVLTAKIYFEQTYDTFYPDADRICQLWAAYSINDKKTEGNTVPGGIAPGLKDEIPQIEAATRFTPLEENNTRFVIFTADRQRHTGKVILADSCLFDVLPRPMVSGNAKEVLSRPQYVLVSESLARSLNKGGDPVGMTLRLDNYPDVELTVGGVFKDIPENSQISYDVVISLASIPKFMWDGSDLWDTNDRYYGYVKLRPNVRHQTLVPLIRQCVAKHLDVVKLKQNGIELSFYPVPLTDIHKQSPGVRHMSVLLGMLAFALLFTAMMNYILIIVSSMMGRSREIAIQKCYGAQGKNITGLILTETLLHIGLALLLAVLLLTLFRGTTEELLSASLSSLFTGTCLAILLAVCLSVFVVTGLIPSGLFSRIPVSTAFRRSPQSRKIWKRILLFIQFMAATFLIILLIIISRQYDRMVNDRPGYNYERVVYCATDGAKHSDRIKALRELNKLPEVEEVGSCSLLPVLTGNNGNGATLNGRTLFNFEDLDMVDTGFVRTMGIKIIDGKMFEAGAPKTFSAMVSRSFAEKLALTAGWHDGVVGKTFEINGYTPATVYGVYEDIRTGKNRMDERPTIMYHTNWSSRYIVIRLQSLTPQAIRQVSDVLKRMLPDKDIVVIPYKAEMAYLYNDSRLMRNTVMIGGIITLLIALIGLIGYVRDETNRRSKEIAIRKVNGATAAQVIALLSREIGYLAIPATLLGAGFAYLAGKSWLEQYPEKITLSPWMFLAGILFTILTIFVCVTLQSWRIATENPAKAIKSE